MPLRSPFVLLEHQLVVARHPVAHYWNAGLAESQARDLLAVGMVPTPELLALYAWKNGQSYHGVPSRKLQFGAPGVFYPLEVALQEYALSQKEYFYEPHSFPYWLATLSVRGPSPSGRATL